MGWTGTEVNINFGMIFKKMYCSKCGALLKKNKITHVYKKGELGYSRRLLNKTTIGMDAKAVTEYVYKCPKCNNTKTYKEQIEISKTQKKLKTKILEKE